MVPVAEAVGILLGITADHCNKGKREHNEDQDNLAARQPELGFTEDLDGKNVEDTK